VCMHFRYVLHVACVRKVVCVHIDILRVCKRICTHACMSEVCGYMAMYCMLACVKYVCVHIDIFFMLACVKYVCVHSVQLCISCLHACGR
jgi:hypothetical protein